MLRIKNLTKIYEDGEHSVTALNKVSLCFRQHEFVSVLGPSGCGKTTLLNIIGGLDRYTSGDLTISGIPTKQFSDHHWDAYRNNSIGFVFQSYNLIPHLTVIDNVALSLSLTGVSKEERLTRAKTVLAKVDLADQERKLPSQLSGGQMQRVAIARALVNNPNVILADEPTGALDSELSVQVMGILKEVSKETLVILVTHNEQLAKAYSDRIINIVDGEVVSDSNPFAIEDSIREDLVELNKLDFSLENKLALLENLFNDLESEIQVDKVLSKDAEAKAKIHQEIILEIQSLKNKILKKQSKKKQDSEKKETNSSAKEEIKKPKFKLSNLFKRRTVMPFKSTSMSYKTATALSLKNMKTKKRRTLLTSFAGSIGIISLALVLALSWGYQKYIESMQKNVLASVPISVYEYTLNYSDLTSMFGGIDTTIKDEYMDSDQITIQRRMQSSVLDLDILSSFKPGRNYLTSDFDNYIRTNINKSLYDALVVGYGSQFNMITKRVSDDGKGEYYSDSSKVPSATSALSIGSTVMGEQGLQASNWHQLVGNEEYMKRYYNIIEGRYPQNKNEIVLVVDHKNEVHASAFESLGLDVYERYEGGEIVEVDNAGYIARRDDDKTFIENIFGLSVEKYKKDHNKNKVIIREAVEQELKRDDNGNIVDIGEENALVKRDEDGNIFVKVNGDFIEITTFPYTNEINNHIIKVDADKSIYITDSESRTLKITVGNFITFLGSSNLKIWEFDESTILKKTFDTISLKDVLSSNLGSIKVVNHNDWFQKISDKEFEEFDIEKAQIEKIEELYNNENNIELKIVGVLKPDRDNLTMGSIVGTHFCYTPELSEYVHTQAIASEIAKAQRESDPRFESTNSMSFNFKSVLKSGKDYSDSSTSNVNVIDFLMTGLAATQEAQRIGAIDSPKFYSIYAKDFDTKTKVVSLLEAYNYDKSGNLKPELDRIEAFDMSEMFIQNIKIVMKLMTIVLLSLAAISLIVSSIMIGIITGNSVYERTREIGMLRALGARKQDIARVFNTETGLIGLFAGLLGIIIPYGLIPLINLGLKIRFGVPNILALNPFHAAGLVLLSLLLTFIAGIIPSQTAAKQDIVKSIRVE